MRYFLSIFSLVLSIGAAQAEELKTVEVRCNDFDGKSRLVVEVPMPKNLVGDTSVLVDKKLNIVPEDVVKHFGKREVKVLTPAASKASAWVKQHASSKDHYDGWRLTVSMKDAEGAPLYTVYLNRFLKKYLTGDIVTQSSWSANQSIYRESLATFMDFREDRPENGHSFNMLCRMTF